MKIETIRKLSAIAPPPVEKFRYRNSFDAHARISQLETELGITATSEYSTGKFLPVREANARVDELERLKANKATGAPPKPSAPALVPAARTSAPMNTCEAMQRAVHSINANAATASPVAGKAIGEALAASGCRTARELRLTNDRDRIAADLPNIKGKLDRECAIAKIAKLNSQIAQFKK